MRKPNLIDAVFRDKAKSDTQIPRIGTLLTQIKTGKLNQQNKLKRQLEAPPSIKDLKIAEHLKRLKILIKEG